MSTTKPERKRKAAVPPQPKEVTTIVEAALDRKASEVVLLDLRRAGGFTDFFVICSGRNGRQVKAIADAVEEQMRTQHGLKPSHVEGYGRAEWVLLDYFDVVVHVFHPDTREFYGLERLWGSAERVEVPPPGPAAPRAR